MSTPRALANQKLYHARILIDAWRVALDEERVASTVLEQAFGTAICDHLGAAYGWFLLEIAQPADMPATPPHGCAQLPAVAQGRETPPEILEFQKLEREGWLARILDPVFGQIERHGDAVARSPHNLALQSEQGFGPHDTEQWHQQLNALFERMSDSLDEY